MIRRSHAVLAIGAGQLLATGERLQNDAHDKKSAPYTQRNRQEWNMFCVEWQ